MKFLRVFINSLLCGLFFSFLLGLLIYDLNINLSFNLLFLFQLTFFLFFSYGLIITIICLMVYFIFEFILGRKVNIFWISPFFLSIFFSLLTLLFFAIFKINQNFFLSFFDSTTEGFLKNQSIAFILLFFSGILINYGYYLYKKKVLFFVLYGIILFALLSFAVYQRARFPIPTKADPVAHIDQTKINKRVTVIGLEGLNFDFLIPLINEGKLPNFSWLMEEGSWGKLTAFTPSEPLIFNSSFNTGKMPAKHRQLSTLKYQLLNFEQEIEVVPRFILFRQLTRLGLLYYRTARSTPITKDIWTVFQENQTPFIKKDWPYKEAPKEPNPLVDTLFEMYFKDLKYEIDPIMTLLKESFYSDCAYENEANTAIKNNNSQISYFMLNGLNIVEKYFFRYSFPNLFGDIDQEDITKYGTVIERYYQFYDRIISKYLATLKENELLVVFSPHSIEALPLWKRYVEFFLGNSTISAYHDNAPEGVVLFYGKEIARSENIEDIRLVDISPTLLYYLNFHVGLDMDGIVRTYIFKDDFRAENPVSYIRTYDQVTIK